MIPNIVKVLFNICILFTISAAQQPDWFPVPPTQPDYYIGTGRSQITDGDESLYKNKANNRAFVEIANKIKTDISSQSTMSTNEDSDSYSEQFDQATETSTIADLEGLILEDSFYGDEYYYVFWKLSKEHSSNIEKYSELARKYFDKSQEARIENDIVTELSYLVKALESIKMAHGGIIESINLQTGEKILLA